MHRVSALLSWDRRKSHKATDSITQLTTSSVKVGKEQFWPGTLEKECEKAGRILKSFCHEGCLAPIQTGDATTATPDEPTTPTKIIQRIPKRIIQNAAGIAVFTCMRSGMWMTGSGGSGILIARKADGTWSPPSALLLHTPTLSFIIGVDIYDCVLIINNLSALESLMKPKITLGEDVGLLNGPMVSHGSLESEIRWKDLGNTVMTYLKSRGQLQTVNLNGCILTERENENERFYTGNVSAMDILAGNVLRHVDETRPLFEVIKQAEGRSDYDSAVIDQLSLYCAPSDAILESPKSTPISPRSATFGIPDTDDPDPFGVLALEMAGLEIREAGTRLRPTSTQFEYTPSPTSPVFGRALNRQSADTFASRSNRGSCLSVRTAGTQTTDACTQTEESNTPHTTPSLTFSEDGRDRTSMDMILKNVDEIDYTKIDFSSIRHLSGETSHSLDGAAMMDSATSTDDDRQAENETENEASADEIEVTTPATSVSAEVAIEDEGADADDEDDEEPVIYEVAAAVQPVRTAMVTKQVLKAKCSLVNIPKRVPPPLPIRSPARVSRSSKSEIGDVSALKSPLRQSFNSDDQSQVAIVPAEIQQFASDPAAEMRPSIDTLTHKHADSQESIATEVASQPTPTVTAHPHVLPLEISHTEESVAEKNPSKASDSSIEAETVVAETMQFEAPVMAATKIPVS